VAFPGEGGFNARLMPGRWISALLLSGWVAAGAGLAQTAAPLPAKSSPPVEVAVLTVGLDARSQAQGTRLTRAIERQLRSAERLRPVRWEVALDPTAHRERTARLEEARVAFTEGVNAYNDLDTQKSIQWLERSMKAYEATDLGHSWPQYIQAWVMKAAAMFAEGKEAEARAELGRLLALEPTAELSSNQFPREVLDFAAGARKGSVGKRSLEVVTTPAGAEVLLDGKPRGFAPLTLTQLAEVPHLLTVKQPGYALTQEPVTGGKKAVTLRPAELGEELFRVTAAIAQAPEGSQRDQTARGLARRVGAAQVWLTLLRKSTTGERLEFEFFRIDVADGHHLAHAQGTLPLDPGLESALDATVQQVAARDAPRQQGRPVLTQTPAAQVPFAWTQRHTGYALLGAGAAAIGVATFFTTQAFSLHAQHRATPQTESASLAESGKGFALAADLTLVAGVLTAAGGAWFAFLAPEPRATLALPMPPPPQPPAPKTQPPAEDDDLKNH